jgi:hypothetical protein
LFYPSQVRDKIKLLSYAVVVQVELNNRIMRRKHAFLAACLAAMLLAACGGRVERICPVPDAAIEGATSSGNGVSTGSPTPLTPKAVNENWGSNPHASTDVRDQPGFERDCRRCHAPLTVFEEATTSSKQRALADAPPEAPTGASVGCAVCHPQKPGQESVDVAILIDLHAGEYRSVASGSELCEPCHTGAQPQGHLPIVLQGVHEELRCLDCHDAHTGAASCTTAGCHQPFQAECEPILSHDKPHSTATCTACHARGDVQIKWDEELQAWHSFFPVEKEGEVKTRAKHAHDLSREVICERCHTPGQLPWMEGG